MNPQPVKDYAGRYSGKELIVVATGPSFDEVPREVYDSRPVFAVNFAMTEFTNHSDCWWICHDLWTCLPRYRMKERLGNYRWRLVTRQCYLPDPLGNVEWRQKGEIRVKSRFHWYLRRIPPKAKILWYADWPDQGGYVRNGNTVLELSLEVARIWGFSRIYIVGADMQKIEGRAYGAPWNNWKPCKIRKPKFVEMRRSLEKNRNRWIPEIYNVSPYWQSPFLNISIGEFVRRVTA